jgi:hypothetical protein
MRDADACAPLRGATALLLAPMVLSLVLPPLPSERVLQVQYDTASDTQRLGKFR